MNKVLGRWIAVLRMDCGLSRRKLAERLGVAPSTVEQWESENAAVPPELVSALADTLHVSTDELLALEAHSSRPRLRSLPGQRPRKRRLLPYPIEGTLAQMLEQGGPLAWALSAQVEQRLTPPAYHRVLSQLPRDNALQLLAMHHLLALGAHTAKTTLLEQGCSLLVTRRTRPIFDSDRERHVLQLAHDDAFLAIFPQVPICVPGCPQIYRADFLVLYVDAYGHRQWLDVTIAPAASPVDDHADCPSALLIPRFRFTETDVLAEDFGPRFVADVRRYMTSDVLHESGVTTLRVRQPARLNAPALTARRDASPSA